MNVDIIRADEFVEFRVEGEWVKATVPAWLVLWFGHIHGGKHYAFGDALQHCLDLDQAPAWDAAQWRDRHGIREVAA